MNEFCEKHFSEVTGRLLFTDPSEIVFWMWELPQPDGMEGAFWKSPGGKCNSFS